MLDEPYVLMVPTGLGGFGRDGVREFYTQRFIPDMPADIQPTPISQVIGHDRIVLAATRPQSDCSRCSLATPNEQRDALGEWTGCRGLP